MEQDVKIGTIGDLDVKLEKGLLSVTAKGVFEGAALHVAAGITMDVGLLIDKLEALVLDKYPTGAPIEAAVFAVLKSGLMSV